MRSVPLILIVDDEENLREIFDAKLKSVGFEVAEAGSGKEAVALAEKLMPDLILMDIHMPGETGTDVALAIKQSPKTESIKIAFLTSLKEPWPAISGDRDKIVRELGMEDYLEKTEDLDTLVKKVQMILKKEAPSVPPPPPPASAVPPVPETQSQVPQAQ